MCYTFNRLNMGKKTIWIIVGIAVVVIIFVMYNNNKKSQAASSAEIAALQQQQNNQSGNTGNQGSSTLAGIIASLTGLTTAVGGLGLFGQNTSSSQN